MIQLILTLLFLAASFKTRPEAATFEPFLKQHVLSQHSTNSNASRGWFSRLLNVGQRQPTIPEFKVTDGLIFMLAQTSDSQTFVGMFGTWFLVNGPSQDSSARSSSSRRHQHGGGERLLEAEQIVEDQEAEECKTRAIRLKGQRDYTAAASAYTSAARLYAAIPNDFAQSQAAQCFEDAGNMYGFLQQHEMSWDSYKSAAEIFGKMDKWASRAARLYEKLAVEHGKRMDDRAKLQYLQRAKAVLEANNVRADNQVFSLDVQIAETLAQQGGVEEALSLFERCAEHAKDDPSLKFSVHIYLLQACFCIMMSGDAVRLSNKVKEYIDRYPIFGAHTDAGFVQALANAAMKSDAALFERETDRYLRFNRGKNEV
ncbi:vesicular-fusion protein S17 [Chytridiales sp. JEL 0842]|nr:vesicular-fusion protein S17 [Chytridiales sp. JEL 0842]